MTTSSRVGILRSVPVVCLRRVGLMVMCVLMALPVFAQTTTTTLGWDFAAPLAEVTSYTQTLVLDGAPVTAPITCSAIPAPSTETTCRVTVPALASGVHTATITATLGTASAALTVNNLTAPTTPKNPKNPRVTIAVTVTVE